MNIETANKLETDGILATEPELTVNDVRKKWEAEREHPKSDALTAKEVALLPKSEQDRIFKARERRNKRAARAKAAAAKQKK